MSFSNNDSIKCCVPARNTRLIAVDVFPSDKCIVLIQLRFFLAIPPRSGDFCQFQWHVSLAHGIKTTLSAFQSLLPAAARCTRFEFWSQRRGNIMVFCPYLWVQLQSKQEDWKWATNGSSITNFRLTVYKQCALCQKAGICHRFASRVWANSVIGRYSFVNQHRNWRNMLFFPSFECLSVCLSPNYEMTK